MIPPGWNVSEPIGLAIKLYRVVEDLKNAPAETAMFKHRILSFTHDLEMLQEILKEGGDSALLMKHIDRLKAVVGECQTSVKRCEDFVANARQPTKWVWKKDTASRLTAEIDSRSHDLSRSIQLVTLRSAFQTSPRAAPTPIRSGTVATLPPYTSPRIRPNDAGEDPQPLRPGGLLGIQVENNADSTSYQSGEASRQNATQITTSSPVSSPVIASMAEVSPVLLPNAELDAGGPMAPVDRRNTQVQVVASSNSSAGSSSLYSTSPFSPPMTSRSSVISPDLPPLEDGLRQRQDSLLSLDEITPEDTMQNLHGVTISFTRGRARIHRPIDKIQVFRRAQVKRYIVLCASDIKYYLKCPLGRPLIPHVEHPIAHGSESTHQVEFLGGIECWSEKAPPRHPFDAPTDFSTAASSAASIRSSSSMASGASGTHFRREPNRQEYDFEEYEDCKRFQEVVLGKGVSLQAQCPIDEINIKYTKGGSVKESELQCVRLWRLGRQQYLSFHANNINHGIYREYQMSQLSKGKAKSNTVTLNAETSELSSRSGVDTSRGTNGQVGDFGLTQPTDGEDMRDLQQMTIVFTKPSHQVTFLKAARFNGIVDDPVLPPFSFQSELPGD